MFERFTKIFMTFGFAGLLCVSASGLAEQELTVSRPHFTIARRWQDTIRSTGCASGIFGQCAVRSEDARVCNAICVSCTVSITVAGPAVGCKTGVRI